MLVVIQQQPVQPFRVTPLYELGELVAHERQFLAGMGEHICIERSEVRELLVVVPGHLLYHGALAVDDLVVGDRKDIVLGIGVHHGEGELVVYSFAEERIGLAVAERIVHPPHVPFVVETEPSDRGGLGYHGPGGGFLRCHDGIGESGINLVV